MVFPTVLLPGYFAGAAPYQGMVQSLNELGYPTTVVPLTRRDWLPTLGGRSVQPVLEKLHQTVTQVQTVTDSPKINLVGHSAGGWLARIYLGETPYAVHTPDQTRRNCWAAHPRVATLVTLGTPHVSQERWTRRNLDFVNQTYPGAFHSTVHYVCIAGKAVYGQPGLRGWFTYNSYRITGGEGACWGDGITPLTAAHLPGAKNVVLDHVFHSPQPKVIWYGTPAVVAEWAVHLQ